MSTIATQVDIDGVLHDVEGRWVVGSRGEVLTWLTITAPVSGDLVTEAQRDGWLDEDRVLLAAEVLVGSVRQPTAHLIGMSEKNTRDLTSEYPNLDHTDFAWVKVHLKGAWVESEDATPTESGLAEVRYALSGERLESLTATAWCTEAQQEAIAELLGTYRDSAREHRGGRLVGVDRICLHDSAFEPEHTVECSLVALDARAEALEVEVRGFLTESDPDTPPTR